MSCPGRVSHPVFLICLALMLMNCAGLAPPKIQVRSLLIPISSELGEGYTQEEDGTLVYQRQGMKVTVRFITDEELNAMFPDHSDKGPASTNPYTYGNWVDPELGYTPNRFTVFKVTVHNYTLPKINLNPAEALLTSDRGDRLPSYVREAKEIGHLSFEDYYRARMRRSGVEENRFAERMGLVRQTLYIDGKVFKGDMKEGFVAFDPLDPRVKKVQLILKDFVLRYDANDWPSELIDLTFPFDRQIEEKIKESQETIAPEGKAGYEMKMTARAEGAPLKDDIWDVSDVNTGRYRAQVMVNPNDKRDLRGYYHVDLVSHRSFQNTAPKVMPNLADYLESYTDIEVDLQKRFSLDSRELILNKVPFIFITGHKQLDFTRAEAKNLGEYLRSGGFLLVDDSHALRGGPFDTSARALIKAALGESAVFRKVPNDHWLYHCFFDFDGPPAGDDMARPDPHRRGKHIYDYLEAIFLDDRMVVLYSNKSLNNAWNGDWRAGLPGGSMNDTRQMQFGVNILAFALTQPGGFAQKRHMKQ